MVRLGIKAARPSAPVETLSGGNQQKVVIAKWLMRSLKVLMLDEPTRGVDVQAKAQIFAVLRVLAAEGVAILFISSELEEVLEVSDRVLTMSRGRIVADTPADKLTMREIFWPPPERGHDRLANQVFVDVGSAAIGSSPRCPGDAVPHDGVHRALRGARIRRRQTLALRPTSEISCARRR